MSLIPVNIVHTVVNQHGPIFAELIDLLADSFGQLGHPIDVNVNRLVGDRLNLLVGATVFLPPSDFATIKSSAGRCILFQLESLHGVEGFAPRFPAYVDFLKIPIQIWDYSPANFPFLAAQACQDIRHIPLGHSDRLERIPHVEPGERDIDVLFCGSISERRKLVLEALQARGVRVKVLFGCYGAARDREISRAKIVLNLHQFATPHLEELRLSYLLNNRCFVISETCDRDPYEGGVVFRDYPQIVESCVSYLAPGRDEDRERIATAGHAALRRISTVEAIRSALQALPCLPAPGG
jgi:hypothetical protein